LFKVTNSYPAGNPENMIPTAMIDKWLEEIREILYCLKRGEAAAGCVRMAVSRSRVWPGRLTPKDGTTGQGVLTH
jgi:hypothetical protein